MEKVISFEALLESIQHVLQNLYDPAELRKSSLVGWLDLETRPNIALAVQDAITNAIQALRPRDDVPIQSQAWRYYNVLVFRYVEQTSQGLVAENLGLSVRQLRREEREAEQILADYIWNKYDLQSLLEKIIVKDNPSLGNLTAEEYPVPSRDEELKWLQDSFPSENIHIHELIQSALNVVNPLAVSMKIDIIYHVSESLPLVTGNLTAMRQALINLLLVAIHGCKGNPVYIDVDADENQLSLTIHTDRSFQQEKDSQISEFLEMAGKFVGLFSGELTVHELPVYQALLQISTIKQSMVLVIDDNADTLHLLQRYLSGTRFCFIGVREPNRALEAALENCPDIIVMDVMMPGLDDWELLGRLRAHPGTNKIPIIICTILPQETLALALGASGFIRKPVNREAFLAVLEQQSSHGTQKQR